MQILPSSIIKFTDPDELKIIMNEFYFHLKNKNGGYYDACYWVAWLIHWEKMNQWVGQQPPPQKKTVPKP